LHNSGLTISAETSGSFTNAAFLTPNISPVQISNMSFGTAEVTGSPAVPENSSSTNYIFDDYLYRASSLDTLLNIESSTEIDFGFRLHPNSAKDTVKIGGLPPSFNNFKISIVDITGQKVMDIKNELPRGRAIEVSKQT